MMREWFVLSFGLQNTKALIFSFMPALIMMVGCSDNCLGGGYDGEAGGRWPPPHPQRQSLPPITTHPTILLFVFAPSEN